MTSEIRAADTRERLTSDDPHGVYLAEHRQHGFTFYGHWTGGDFIDTNNAAWPICDLTNFRLFAPQPLSVDEAAREIAAMFIASGRQYKELRSILSKHFAPQPEGRENRLRESIADHLQAGYGFVRLDALESIMSDIAWVPPQPAPCPAQGEQSHEPITEDLDQTP